MDNVIINDVDSNIILHFNDKQFYGYKFFKNGSIENVDKSVLSYFDFLHLSNNKTFLKEENGYQIYLDNETNYKHYLKDGKEDISMFFENNGEDAILYDGESNIKKDKAKKFKSKLRFITMSLRNALLIYLASNAIINTTPFFKPTNVEDIKIEQVQEKINSSKYLSEEEKEYLFNEDFLRDILPYINEEAWLKYIINNSIEDIRIDNYNFDYGNGFYNPLRPNIINVKNYEGIISRKDTVSHEFVHLCQAPNCDYNLLIEASAEIISYEYFEESKLDAYKEPVYLVRKLMEIIGPEAIRVYVFTGDFSMIENSVKPYLSDGEYKEFLKSLKFNTFNPEDHRFKSLDSILDKLYFNKYGKKSSEDEVIPHLKDNSLVRYYFNSRLIDKENSYYCDYENYNTSIKNEIEKGNISATICFPFEGKTNNFKTDQVEIQRQFEMARNMGIDGYVFKVSIIKNGVEVESAWAKSSYFDCFAEEYPDSAYYVDLVLYLPKDKVLELEDINICPVTDGEETRYCPITYYYNSENRINLEDYKIYLPTIYERENIEIKR